MDNVVKYMGLVTNILQFLLAQNVIHGDVHASQAADHHLANLAEAHAAVMTEVQQHASKQEAVDEHPE